MPAARATHPARRSDAGTDQDHRPGHHRPHFVRRPVRRPGRPARRRPGRAARTAAGHPGPLAARRLGRNRSPGQRPRLVLAHPGRDAPARPELQRPGTIRGPLAHIRAVLAVRLWLESGEVYREGRAWWRSERRIRAAAGGGSASPTSPTPKSTGHPSTGPVCRADLRHRGRAHPQAAGADRRHHAGHADPHHRLRPQRARAPGRPLRPDHLPDRPGRDLDRDPVDRGAPRAVAAPDGRPGPPPGAVR